MLLNYNTLIQTTYPFTNSKINSKIHLFFTNSEVQRPRREKGTLVVTLFKAKKNMKINNSPTLMISKSKKVPGIIGKGLTNIPKSQFQNHT